MPSSKPASTPATAFRLRTLSATGSPGAPGGLSAKTINDYKSLAESNLIPFIGAHKLKELTADNVDDWLEDRRDHLTTRTMQAIHSILRRSIRRAQARDKVVRNVATLVDTPEGRKDGRPSKAMNLDQATTVLEHAKNDQLHAYVVLSLMTGVRTEEARALRWSHVVAWVPEAREWRPVTDTGFRRKKYAVYVWRSVREDGDTKTQKSRRTLEIPTMSPGRSRSTTPPKPRNASKRAARGTRTT